MYDADNEYSIYCPKCNNELTFLIEKNGESKKCSYCQTEIIFNFIEKNDNKIKDLNKNTYFYEDIKATPSKKDKNEKFLNKVKQVNTKKLNITDKRNESRNLGNYKNEFIRKKSNKGKKLFLFSIVIISLAFSYYFVIKKNDYLLTKKNIFFNKLKSLIYKKPPSHKANDILESITGDKSKKQETFTSNKGGEKYFRKKNESSELAEDIHSKNINTSDNADNISDLENKELEIIKNYLKNENKNNIEDYLPKIRTIDEFNKDANQDADQNKEQESFKLTIKKAKKAEIKENEIKGIKINKNTLFADQITAINNYFTAASWQEQINFIRNSSELKKNVESYYLNKEFKSETPLHAAFHSFHKNSKTGNNVYIFFVRTEKNPNGYHIFLEQVFDNFYIDWASEISLNNNDFYKFTSKTNQNISSDEVAKYFRVFFSLDPNYRNLQISDIDDFYFLKVNVPKIGASGNVNAFVSKDSEIGKFFSNNIKVNKYYSGVLKLKRIKYAEGKYIFKILNAKSIGEKFYAFIEDYNKY